MNRVLLDLGFIKIYWYSFLILIGAFLGCYLALREGKKRGLTENFMINYFFYLIPIGIIGARLYYCLFKFSEYQNNLIDIFKIWEGGLAIHGGIIAGLIFTFFYTKKNKVPFLALTDIAAVGIILAQAIGRWGNFFNGEAFGPQTSLSFLQSLHLPQFIIDGMYIYYNGSYNYYQPTFLYESFWCLIGFILLIIIRKNKKLIRGHLTAFYLIWYGTGRFFIEGLRDFDYLKLGSFRVAQVISLLGIIIGIILILYTAFKNKKYYHEEIKDAGFY